MIFFHADKLASFATDVGEHLTTISVQARSGYPSDSPPFFRLANGGSEVVTVRLETTNEIFQLSTNRISWQQTITLDLDANRTSDAVFLRIAATDGSEEGTYSEHIVATNESDPYELLSLPVTGLIGGLNEFDSEDSQAKRFAGKETTEIDRLFQSEAEQCRIVEYTPLEKPDRNEPVTSLQQLRNRNVAEQSNPYNQQVGYRSAYWTCKAFVGNRETITNRFFDVSAIDVNFAEENSIILPANFPGFCPSPQKTLVEFGDITPFVTAYQSNVFTMFRSNAEFALRNIKSINLPRGQIGFWLADLQRIVYPNADNPRGFLPWSILYDDQWREISYVPSWSTEQVSEDPYCPYLEGEYQ